MSDNKIVIPPGMLKAFDDALYIGQRGEDFIDALTASLQWLSENPIVPTDHQVSSLANEHDMPNLKWMVVEWQRRMFRAPPEVPEDVQHLVNQLERDGSYNAEYVECQILEAYKLGKEAATIQAGYVVGEHQ